MATVVRLSQQYGEEAGAGGNVTWYKGSININTMEFKIMIYLLWAENQGISWWYRN